MLTKEQKLVVLNAVEAASARWVAAFNSGDAAGCVEQYEQNAVMHARPFGMFKGAEEIQQFWQGLIDDGFSNVEYVYPQIEIIDETSAVLTSAWRMNKAGGIIHKELWVMQADGSAKLRDDDFEAKE